MFTFHNVWQVSVSLFDGEFLEVLFYISVKSFSSPQPLTFQPFAYNTIKYDVKPLDDVDLLFQWSSYS